MPGSTFGLSNAPVLSLVDDVTGHPIHYVVKDSTYKLHLKGFQDGATVNLFAVATKTGLQLPIGTIGSFAGPEMEWDWTVSPVLIKGEQYSIKGVQLNNPNKVGYATEVVVEDTYAESGINRYLKKQTDVTGEDYHPSIPQTVNRMKRLLSSRLVTKMKADTA